MRMEDLKKFIKEGIEKDGKCHLQLKHRGLSYCYFASDTDCGYQGNEEYALGILPNRIYYRACLLDKEFRGV